MGLFMILLALVGCNRQSASPEEAFARAEQAEAARQYDKALSLYRRAAKYGHGEAQFWLGRYYEQGYFPDQDGAVEGPVKDRAMPGSDAWYRFWSHKWYCDAADTWGRAAGQGDAEAQVRLGYMYYLGACEDADTSRARAMWQQAAHAEHPAAPYWLGMLEWEARAYPAALQHFRRAADAGHLPAYHRIAMMYAQGQGVRKSLVESVAVLAEAAEKGSEQAQEDKAALIEGLRNGASRGNEEAARLLDALKARGLLETAS